MKEHPSKQISKLLAAWGNGDQDALQELIPIVYQELHRLASSYMRKERTGITLQTSALVNEAYLKLVDQRNVQWQNRAHFFGVAAQLMRRILLDHAKSRTRLKRGGKALKLSLDQDAIASVENAQDFLYLDEALT